ncbi:RibD family protein [Prochlorococcus marinus]|uniref:RibD family protein n=1 Tax=Prochlorococcus marinus TaxID=1219 RepID=UPI0022B37265|nr:dihydrofolate reductase family protein [Prochlorococcus marinus]
MTTKPWVRLVIAISLDGRLAEFKGGKSNLGGTGDRKALEKALAWCDATLMGSGTLKAHKNTCLIHNEKLINKRQANGQTKQPLSLIVSRQTSFPNTWEFFQQPIERGLINPNLKSDYFIENDFIHNFCMQPTWEETLKEIKKKGYTKLLLLGGSKLISSLLLEDQIDELQFTLTPKILGGQYTWIPSNIKNLPSEITEAKGWTIKEIENLGENEIMVIYLRNRT